MMKRTIIVTIDIEANGEGLMNVIEDSLLAALNDAADDFHDCSVHANICVSPLPQPLIEKE